MHIIKKIKKMKYRLWKLIADRSGDQSISWFAVIVLSIIIAGIVIGPATGTFPRIWNAIVVKLEDTFDI